MRKAGSPLPLPKGRIALLIVAAVAMLIALVGAVSRSSLSLGPAALPAPLPDFHGALMVYGFLGGAISLERAVAYRAGSDRHPRWGFFAAVCAIAGTISVLVISILSRVVPSFDGRVWLPLISALWWAASMLILSAVYVGIWFRQRSYAVLIQLLGSWVGMCGVLLWAGGVAADNASTWWMMMLILTIVGERLELAHASFVGAYVQPALLAASIVTSLSLVAQLCAPEWGYPLSALCLAALLVLMLRHDTARRTYKAHGVTGFMGVCMISAYSWALVACGIWLLVPFGGLGSSTLWWDMALHALAIGFVMAMVAAHVCVIVPSIIRRPMPFHPVLWGAFILYQAGLLLRLLGTVRNSTPIWQIGDVVAIFGMIAMMLSVITMLVLARKRRTKVATMQETARAKTVARAQQNPAKRKQTAQDPYVVDTQAHMHNSGGTDNRALDIASYASAAVCVVLLIVSLVLAYYPQFVVSADEASAAQIASTAQTADTTTTQTSSQSAKQQATVAPTGHTTKVKVSVSGMSFTPSRIEVPLGDALEITFTNTGDQTHDLVIETGQSTGRVQPGATANIRIDVVERSLDAWCSVAGHRQMGMTLRIEAKGETGSQESSHAGMHGNNANSATSSTPKVSMAQLQEYAAKVPAADARMPQHTSESNGERRYTITIQQGSQQVTDNLTRQIWTFSGTQPGPVLRGKVGDVFDITLVNNADMDHSIDFHAGDDAVPNDAMRSIAPGKTLHYRFTASRSGIWMYHCSSMPMSLHIANGMYGAVIIDPEDGLDNVDAEYVLIQSEQYLGENSAGADSARIDSLNPDIVAFNGRAFQYDAHPLTMPQGGTARIWVLNAGPNIALSFHVVGAQFSTVWSEGHYTVRNNRDVVSGQSGSTGSQALALLPAQGGFVELSIPKAGDYPFVNHAMSFAERGAHGILHVE